MKMSLKQEEVVYKPTGVYESCPYKGNAIACCKVRKNAVYGQVGKSKMTGQGVSTHSKSNG